MEPFPTREAERLLKEWGINSLPIKPLQIAQQNGIICQPMPSKNRGVSGMFVRQGNAYGILYATHIDNEGFQNFSIAHELGHYFLPGHPEAVLSGGAVHSSGDEFTSDDKYENEADQFACGLLMPNYLFDPALDHVGSGIEAIKSLSELCTTSLTATAIRYAQRTPEPAAIVVSVGNKVDYCFMSDELNEYPGIRWVKKDTELPRAAKTYEFNNNQSNVLGRKENEGMTDFSTWFGGDIEGELYEQVVGLGDYNKTLTVLTASDLPSIEELEEDKELEESWTPRFKR